MAAETTTTPAQEVAEDYRRELEELSGNLRVEISGLTMIACESTEHAMVISDVLIQHILKAAPSKKLPALYVLDSIVKNVGTPYTLYFGRSLFKVFMESYAVVDHNVRRKMEEMLRTWKEPVPGSMDTRPVFPPELVRPIENALIKARTSALQAQQQHQQRPLSNPLSSRGRAPTQRDTPTPPQAGQFPVQQHYPGAESSAARQQFPHGQVGDPVPTWAGTAAFNQPALTDSQLPFLPPPHSTPSQLVASISALFPPPPDAYPGMPLPSSAAAAAAAVAAGAGAGISIDSLNNDIQNLVVATQAQARYDGGAQHKLAALLQLQSLLSTQNLSREQLAQVKNQVAELSVNMSVSGPGGGAGGSAAAAPVSTPVHSTAPFSAPVAGGSRSAAAEAADTAAAATAQPPLTLDSILGQGSLAALLAAQTVRSHPTPQPHHQPAQIPAPTSSSEPMALVEQLRRAGLLPTLASTPTAAAAPTPPPAPPRPPHPLTISPMLASVLARAGPPAPGPAPMSTISGPLREMNEIALHAMALKKGFRPHLMSSLFQDLGQPCTQCGRRFRTDEESRKKKMAHMDWHFHVHQRLSDAEKKGQHRSWYVTAQDWIDSREAADTTHHYQHVSAGMESSSAGAGAGSAAGAGAGAGGAGGASGWDGGAGGGADSTGPSVPPPPARYIAVPDPTSGIEPVCPICQDRFENKWLDTDQEWVWLDAVLVRGRAYHASCHDEAAGDAAAGSRVTPEPAVSALGRKRKAEDDLYVIRGKLKMDA